MNEAVRIMDRVRFDTLLRAACPLVDWSIGKWFDPDTVTMNFHGDATGPERAAAVAVVAGFSPATRARIVPTSEFISRLPSDRAAEVVAAMNSVPAGQLWLLKLTAAQTVNLDSDELKQGVGFMLASGVIDDAEADTLLG